MLHRTKTQSRSVRLFRVLRIIPISLCDCIPYDRGMINDTEIQTTIMETFQVSTRDDRTQ